MPVSIATATSDADLTGILTLQAVNQKAVVSADYQQQQGFVETGTFTDALDRWVVVVWDWRQQLHYPTCER